MFFSKKSLIIWRYPVLSGVAIHNNYLLTSGLERRLDAHPRKEKKVYFPLDHPEKSLDFLIMRTYHFSITMCVAIEDHLSPGTENSVLRLRMNQNSS
jgi:hypothetical protein